MPRSTFYTTLRSIGWILVIVGSAQFLAVATFAVPTFVAVTGLAPDSILLLLITGLASIGVGSLCITTARDRLTRPFPLGDCQGCGYPGAATGHHPRCPECGWVAHESSDAPRHESTGEAHFDEVDRRDD